MDGAPVREGFQPAPAAIRLDGSQEGSKRGERAEGGQEKEKDKQTQKESG